MAKTPTAEDIALIREQFADAVTDQHERFGEISLVVKRESIVDVCRFLRNDSRFQYNLLSDLGGVVWVIDADPRFQVNYHLYSIPNNTRLRLKVLVGEEDPTVPTVSDVWRTANWHERETFDFFGIIFDGHPDLRRILMPEEFQWHPLRKDFPVRGYDDF
jgi:NADH-quinone oxidoreductase subunit C